MSWEDFLNSATDEDEIERFVTELVDVKDIQTLREELSEYYLDRYLEMSRDQAGREMLAEIMEAEEFSPKKENK